MTPTEIITLAKQGTNNENSTYFSDAELFSYLTAGVNEAALESKIYEVIDTSLSTVASQQNYTLPVTIFEPKRIEVGGLKLRPSTLVEMDKLQSAIQNQPTSGTPRFYALWDKTVIMLPIPDSALSIKIYGHGYQSTISSGTTVIGPVEFHARFADFVIYRMRLKEKEFQAATYHKGIWDGHKQWMKMQMLERKRRDQFSLTQNEDQSISNVLGLI